MITVANIQQAVAAHRNIPVETMRESARHPIHAHPRQEAMYLARQITGKSLVVLGRLFGGRDHSTIVHGIQAVERRLKDNSKLAGELSTILASLYGVALNDVEITDELEIAA